MRKKASTLVLPLLLLSVSAAAAPDWSKVPARSINVFHAGATPFEWINNTATHIGAVSVKKNQQCIVCHETKAGLDYTAARLATREPDKALVPATVVFPVSVQATYDKDALYVRASFKPPADSKPGGDADNELKASLMLLDDKVPLAAQAGCWTACHQDLRGMPAGGAKGKYVAAGSFELLTWKSGKSPAALPDGVKVDGGRKGDLVTVTFTHKLAGAVVEGRSVPFGIAVHANRASGRQHYVSLGYRIGIGAAGEVQALKQ